MFRGWHSRICSTELAVDLGTANTLIYFHGRGIVLDEPSIVAISERDGSVVAVGREAKAMLGRTPDSIVAIRPMKNGVIADFEIAQTMLESFIARVVRQRRLLRPRVIIAVPSGITQVEKRAVRDSALNAGAREVYLIAEPMAAALGAGLPVDEPTGNLIVDVGGGTTEVAVISLSGIVHSSSVRVGGDDMDEAVLEHVKNRHNVLIGHPSAEAIKTTLGSAVTGGGPPRTMEVKGRDLVHGLPKTIVITEREIAEAIREPVAAIVVGVRHCLEHTPPELAADLVDKGIVLMGGGALLRNLDERLRAETGLPVTMATDPRACVALGAGRVLERLALLRHVAIPIEGGAPAPPAVRRRRASTREAGMTIERSAHRVWRLEPTSIAAAGVAFVTLSALWWAGGALDGRGTRSASDRPAVAASEFGTPDPTRRETSVAVERSARASAEAEVRRPTAAVFAPTEHRRESERLRALIAKPVDPAATVDAPPRPVASLRVVEPARPRGLADEVSAAVVPAAPVAPRHAVADAPGSMLTQSISRSEPLPWPPAPPRRALLPPSRSTGEAESP